MAIDRELVTAVRRLDEFELRQLLLLVRGLLVHVDGHPEPAREPDLPATLRYRQEQVRCGKSSCTSCPHGPYWYAYWKEDGRTRKRYIGRHLPGEPLEPVVPDLPERAGPAAVVTGGRRPAGAGAEGRE
ncbi:MAG: hypothetical protein WD010_09235 [Nitriliruptor sp.]|uniref:hypothetical protein n=1 Tax=Nitriliruptor sp. TaxID=2448056 RepID=UPI0034A08212